MRRGMGKVVAVSLLLLYIAGTSQLEWVHSFAHDQGQRVSHGDEQELDPCHRQIHHNDKEQGCDHDAHLIVSDKCQMCDLACQADQTIFCAVDFATADFLAYYIAFYKGNPGSYRSLLSSSRAPPAVM